MKVTKELIKEFEEYQGEILGEYDEEVVKEAIKTLRENEGKELDHIDFCIVRNAILDNDELYNKISACEKQEEERNAFE